MQQPGLIGTGAAKMRDRADGPWTALARILPCQNSLNSPTPTTSTHETFRFMLALALGAASFPHRPWTGRSRTTGRPSPFGGRRPAPNEEPATRVVATGIRNETPMLMVQFQDASLEPIKQGGYF